MNERGQVQGDLFYALSIETIQRSDCIRWLNSRCPRGTPPEDPAVSVHNECALMTADYLMYDLE